MKIQIEKNDKWRDEIDQKLHDFNTKNGKSRYFTVRKNPDEGREIGFYLLQDSLLIGGATAIFRHDWLFVDELFVDESFRGQKLGSSILTVAEDFARQNHLVGLYLETHEFQARGFYEKNGFTCIGELPDFPRGDCLFFMRKILSQDSCQNQREML